MIAPLGGLLTGAAGVTLLGRAWQACDIGAGGGANAFGLLLAFVPLVLVTTAVWGLAFATVGRSSAVAALGCALLGSALLLWAFMAWKHAPPGYPAPICPPDNVPPWWPGWLPL